MTGLTLRFAAALIALWTGSRIALALWQHDRVTDAGGPWPVIAGGLRIDASLLAMLVLVPVLLAPWIGRRAGAVRITAWAYRVLFVVAVFFEGASPTFIAEYDTRPNRLFVDYLASPLEVGGMLLRGFGGALLAVAGVMALAVWVAVRLFPTRGAAVPASGPTPAVPRPAPHPGLRLAAGAVALLGLGLIARGTLDHRPINPSTVAFGNDAMVNTLPLNGLYSVAHAVYRSRGERSSRAAYGSMPDDEMVATVLASSGLPAVPLDPHLPTLHRQVATHRRAKPLNLVIVIEESLGAQFVGSIGGRDLTPNLDRHARDGWYFRRAFATGTRSARGLEAITTGFPPTPSEPVLKLPGAQSGFFTLARLLGEQGYASRFVYGGEAHFDNMKAFFLGNGFDAVIDRDRFAATTFVGTWGASDDDLFAEVDRLLRRDRVDGGRPTLTVAFTVSNHTPWEFPPGRIAVQGRAGADDAIRYADRALGDFLDRARAAPYWQDTVFLVIADHDARAGGASLVPVRNFHVPALILGADVAARLDDRLVSQIDMAPTLLSLAGVDSVHPMIGADLTVRSPDRAMMQYGDNFGYRVDERLIVLEPGKPARQFRHQGSDDAFMETDLDPVLGRTALAQVLWPEWAYRNRRFRLGQPAAVAKSGGLGRDELPTE